MKTLGTLVTMIAVAAILVDPLWCPDGCMDESEFAQTHNEEVSACALCSRTVISESSLPTPPRAVAVVVAAEAAVFTIPVGWQPAVEHPPRF